MKTLMTTILILASLALTACPGKHKSEPPRTQVRTVQMGDPMKVLEGARFQPKIDFDFFNDTPVLKLKAGVSFQQKQQLNVADQLAQSDPEEENAPDNGEDDLSIKMTVERTKNADGTQQVSLSTPEVSLVLIDPPQKGHALRIISADKKSSVAELLHFSVSADGQGLSLLIRSIEPDSGLQISALYFSKNMEEHVNKDLNRNYNYLNGPGVQAAWPEGSPIDLGICGGNGESIYSEISSAKNQWNQALEGLRTIELSPRKEYAPFSDLNQHCIFYVDSFLVNPQPDIAAYGVTVTLTVDSKILDGDILLFKSEFLKADFSHADLVNLGDLNRTVVHEMGHFLGLDHKFDGTPSVMSYDFSDGSTLLDYDTKAIQELYKP